MRKFLNKIKGKRKIILGIVLFCVVLGLIFGINPVIAQDSAAKTATKFALAGTLGTVGQAVSLVLGVIAYILTAILGLLITVLVQILIQVAQFNNIIDVPTVVEGWVIVRDLGNMFFILILLVIAFATILRVESYSVKKMLPKLLIMAVLINFSKTIFGLLIDFSQVIMLTFVNSFKEGGGLFMDLFRVDLWYSIRTAGLDTEMASYGLSTWATALAIIAGVAAAIVTFIVITVMLAVLVMRIVMLWIYTILSPLVFLGFAFPPLQKYTGQIWEGFIKQLVIGPALAFFIWLALTTASKSSELMSMTNEADEICAGISAFFCQKNLQQFIIVIGLLIGGLMITQQMGGAIAKVAGQAGEFAAWGLKTGANWGALKLKSGAISEIFAKKTIDEETGKVSWEGRGGLGKFGAGLASTLYGLETRPTKIIEGIGRALKTKEAKDETKGIVASAEGLKKGGVLGLIKGLGVSEDLTNSLAQGYFYHKGFKKAAVIVTGTREKRDELMEEIKKDKEGLGYTDEDIAEVDKDIAEKQNLISETDSEIAGKEKEIKETKDKTKIAELQEQKRELEADKADSKLDIEDLGEEKKRRQEKKKQWEKANNREFMIDEKEKEMEKIEEKEKRLKGWQPIQTFYADREREALVSEAKKRIGDNDNEEELFAMMENAIASDDQGAAAAVLLHATNVYHGNEMIERWKSTKDVKDPKTGQIIKKGQNLSANGFGLNTLINQAFIEGLGMTEQQAYALQRDVSTVAQAKNHWTYSQTIGMKNGMLFQRDTEEQVDRARGELRKTDAERSIRGLNRLGWFTEMQEEYINEKGEVDIRRRPVVDGLTKKNFVEWIGTIATEIGRERFNPNAAMNAYMARDGLRKFIKELKKENFDKVYLKDPKTGKVRETSYEEIGEDLIEYGRKVYRAEGLTKSSGEATE